jgi:uncharacterized protein YfaQ (DUF2300 family)
VRLCAQRLVVSISDFQSKQLTRQLKQAATANSVHQTRCRHDPWDEICVAKPRFITGQGRNHRRTIGTVLWLTGAVASIDIKEVSVAMLHRIVHGFEGTEGLLPDLEVVSLGREFLRNTK